MSLSPVPPSVPTGVDDATRIRGRLEVSRFSCLLLLGVRWFFDYAGPTSHSRLTRPVVLPSPSGEWGRRPERQFSELTRPARRCPCLRFTRHLAMPPARLRVRMESLAPFLQGSFIPCNMPVYPGAPLDFLTVSQ
jgi:hypothetical protein